MAQYLPQPAVNGDTFLGFQLTVLVNGTPLNLTSASIIMTVDVNGTPVVFSTGNGKLVITDATHGIFEFSKQIVDFWSYGNFPYEMTFRLSNGDVKTYINGSWTITRS